MESKRIGFLVAALWCAMSVSANAQASPPSLSATAPVTVSDLDAIQQEEILLKALASRARQRAELGRFASEAEAAGVSRPSLPSLAWRRSTASGWLAKFVLADGSSVIAGISEQLPGGFSVESISEHGVTLNRDGELIDLVATTSGSERTELGAGAIVPAGPGSR